jgi:hypothetical protein
MMARPVTRRRPLRVRTDGHAPHTQAWHPAPGSTEAAGREGPRGGADREQGTGQEARPFR